MFENSIRRLKHIIVHKSIFMILAIRNGIITRGFLHDIDKLSMQSIVAYSKCNQPEIGHYVMRHRVSNRHHPQYWHMRGTNPTDTDLIEMATDFYSVSVTKKGGLKPVAYLRKNLHSKYKYLISPEDLLRLVKIFERLRYFK